MIPPNQKTTVNQAAGPRTRNASPLGLRAFTLIELLISITIIAILAALLIGGVGKMKKQGQKVQCSAKLRELATVMFNYANDNDGEILAFGRNGGTRNPVTGKKSGGKTWSFAIQDYMGESWAGRSPKRIQICPSADESFGHPKNGVYRSYGINFDGQRWDDEPTRLVNHTNPSKTVLFMDSHLTGSDGDCYAGFQSSGGDSYLKTCDWRHDGRVNAVFLDGHGESFDKSPTQLAELKTAIQQWSK